MKEAALLALSEGIEIDQIQITEAGLVVSVIATHPQSCCPLCLQPSSHIHSHYHRTLKDAPCVGRQLQLSLTVRKFFCRNPYCSRKVFTERLPDLAEPWARMTTRLREQITSIGLATCGKGGVRLGNRLGVETSRNTTLHRIMDVTAVWLIIRDKKSLDEIEQEDLATFCQASPTLKRTYDLVQDFMQMVRKREGHRIDAWLERVASSNLAELQTFAAGVEKDKAAVKAGLTWPVNNGQVEGQVTKLKLSKRQMYGKAGFALLRQRVLHAL